MKQTHIAIAFMAMMLLGGPSYAEECHVRPTDDGRWRWATVGDRQCWYRGKDRLSKERLMWKESEDDILLHSYWPPMPENTLDERFAGEKK